jgi:hypothetical protein
MASNSASHSLTRSSLKRLQPYPQPNDSSPEKNFSCKPFRRFPTGSPTNPKEDSPSPSKNGSRPPGVIASSTPPKASTSPTPLGTNAGPFSCSTTGSPKQPDPRPFQFAIQSLALKRTHLSWSQGFASRLRTSRSLPHPLPSFCPPFFCQSTLRSEYRIQQSGARQPAKGCPKGEAGGPRQNTEYLSPLPPPHPCPPCHPWFPFFLPVSPPRSEYSRAEQDSQPKAARRARPAGFGKSLTTDH